MPDNRPQVLQAVRSQLELQTLEQQELRARLYRSVVSKTASGVSHIGHLFSLDRKYRLVFVRCHFTGTSSTAEFVISLDSAHGSSFNTRLFSVPVAGVGSDVHLRIDDGNAWEPSAWTLQADDSVRIDWSNPDPNNITWGLEVGLVFAS